MKHESHEQIRDLIDRLSRITASEHWVADLNPAQLAALSYLEKANQYSRAPSQIAEYLSAMRGTVSGTLKALTRKGLIEEHKSETDRRRTSFTITKTGRGALDFETSIDKALQILNEPQTTQLSKNLKELIKNILHTRGGRSFGICASCKHNEAGNNGSYCTLLNTSLSPTETNQICFEHQSALGQ